MIENTLTWIEKVNKKYNIQPENVLDIGSLDTNGNPKHLFPDSNYCGIDIRDGQNVDMVMDAYILSKHFPNDHFDAVLCLNSLEHMAYPWKILDEISCVLSIGGYFYISVPNFGFPKHNHPKDYWRASEEAVREVLMQGYKIISLGHGKSKFGKHPIINCLGVKK